MQTDISKAKGILFLKQGALRRSEYGVRDQISGWWIRIGIIARTRSRFADRLILWLRLGDRYRRSFVNKREKFWSRIRMKAQTTMGVWDGPDGSLVKTVGRLEFHPIRHRITDVVIAG